MAKIAAHCITGPSVTKNHFSVVSVRLGEHNLLTAIDCEDGECAEPVIDVPIAERIIHESYEPSSRAQANDIALLRLVRPVAYKFNLISLIIRYTLIMFLYCIA